MKLYLVSVLSLFILCTSLLAQATTDPELKQCKHKCKVQRQYVEDEKRECVRQCEDYYRQKEREREREEGRRGGGRRGEDEWGITTTSDPEKRLRDCQKQCERQEGQQRSLCQHRCQERYERERGRGEEEEHGRGREEEEERGRGRGRGRGREEEEILAEQEENPYVFDVDEYTSKVKTQHGYFDILPRFTKKSALLRGIENYRVGILEANPQTFVAPTHWDADAVLFVAKGRGTITTIHEQGEKRSHNIEYGDVIRVRAGTPIYLINRDENEKLLIVKFINPVNLPGKSQAFKASAGGEDESFYSAFSWELLEAALKTDRRRIEQVLKQQQDPITKASKEQIQGMTHRDQEGGTIWPFGGESSGAPFNLLNKRPVQSNNYGQLFEARPNEHKEQLKDLDLTVSFANITRGSMAGPFYNSRATKISIVTEGEGYFEMACPHLSGASQQQTRKRGQTYQKVSSRLRPGTVFIVPAGHPVATVASTNNNLEVVCFEVNAQGNIRYNLAGKNNVVKQWEREAKELAFGAQAREQVEHVFGSQQEEFFFPGPRRQERQGRADA